MSKSPLASDLNSGLSWGAAVATIAQAKANLNSTTGKGIIYLGPGMHDIGEAGSSSVGLIVDQNLHIIGSGPQQSTSSQGGTEIRYLGTGIAIQTATNATTAWSGGLLRDFAVINGGSGTVGIDCRNPQNGARIENVRVGSTADPTMNFSSKALLVESTDGTHQYPGFFKVEDCWFTGGQTVVECQAGVTTTSFINVGIDTDARTAVAGFNHVSNPTGGADAGADLVMVACKMEIHGQDVDGYVFDSASNITLIGCDARNTAVSTKTAYKSTGAYVSPPEPRIVLLNCHSYQYPTWFKATGVSPSISIPVYQTSTIYQDSFSGVGQVGVRRLFHAGRALDVGADVALSTGWGATASKSLVAGGSDLCFGVNITPGGAGLASNPKVTISFHDGAFPAPPMALVTRNDASAPATAVWTYSTSTTTVTLTFNGLPVAGKVYRAMVWVVG